MGGEAIKYDASQIEVLDGREAIRRRPGMYVGSTSKRGLHQLVYEVINPAVNEVLAGRATSIDVTLTPGGGVRVADDGPGIPFEGPSDTGGPGLETQLTQAYAGADPRSRHAPILGLLGMGLFVANALSSQLTAEVQRDGVRWVQHYGRGLATTPPTDAGPATENGTTIAFQPDTDIFGTAECSFDTLAARFKELAFLNRDLDISLTDERNPAEPRSARYRFPDGTRDFVTFLDPHKGAPLHPDVIGFDWDDPQVAGTVEIAFQWCSSSEERIQSFANSQPTPGGGTHADGFLDGMTAAVNAYARERRLLTATDPELHPDRIRKGLIAVVSVKLDDPVFLGATHGALGGHNVRARIAQAVQKHLKRWLDKHPAQAAAIIDHIIRGACRD